MSYARNIIRNSFWFFQGYGRYYLVKLFGWDVLRGHIAEQIISRVMSADKKCKGDGKCKICGCHTPMLFYAGKACDKPCYPKMMGRREWERFVNDGGDEDWNYFNGKFYSVNKIIE